MSKLQRMAERTRSRQDFVANMPPPELTAGGIALGQAPSKEQIEKMKANQIEGHLFAVSQTLYNEVVSKLVLAQATGGEPLAHDKCSWVAEQCRQAAPYVLAAFGHIQIGPLPEQAPAEETSKLVVE